MWEARGRRGSLRGILDLDDEYVQNEVSEYYELEGSDNTRDVDDLGRKWIFHVALYTSMW